MKAQNFPLRVFQAPDATDVELREMHACPSVDVLVESCEEGFVRRLERRKVSGRSPPRTMTGSDVKMRLYRRMKVYS